MTSNSDNQKAVEQWPSIEKYQKSLKKEFLLFIGSGMIVLMLVLGYVVTNQYVETVTGLVVKELIVKARSASGMAANHLISTETPDKLMLSDICTKLVQDNADIFWVGISGIDDKFLAHTDISKVISEQKLTQIDSDYEKIELLREHEKFTLTSDTILLTIPIIEEGITLGTIAISSSNRPVQEARWSSIQIISIITFGLIFLGIPGMLLIVKRKLYPIEVITQGLRNADMERLDIPIDYTSYNEFGYLADTLRTMGSKLSIANKEIQVKNQMERELQIAHDIQSSILPTNYPKTDSYEFYGVYRSALEVGGDYFDIIDFDSNYLGFLIADVSGKSLPAMLFMLLTRDIVRKVLSTTRNPAIFLKKVNRELNESITSDSFVSMFFGLLDKRTGELINCSAGHTSILHVAGKTNRVNKIKTRGYPLGLTDNDKFEVRLETSTISLAEGDSIIMYTDGITEAVNSNGEQYGLDRLINESLSNRTFSTDKIVKNIMHQHQNFVGNTPQFDDITLLVFKWLDKTPYQKNIVPREEYAAKS